MARTPRLTPKFLARRQAYRFDDATLAAISRTIAAISVARNLPGVEDIEAPIPPTGKAFVRRAPGANAWIWYRLTDVEVVFVNVTNAPPVPIL